MKNFISIFQTGLPPRFAKTSPKLQEESKPVAAITPPPGFQKSQQPAGSYLLEEIELFEDYLSYCFSLDYDILKVVFEVYSSKRKSGFPFDSS